MENREEHIKTGEMGRTGGTGETSNEVKTTGVVAPPLPPPHIEEERLKCLRGLGILNDEPVPLLNMLCDYAVSYTGVTTAAVSLIDRNDVLFKATSSNANLPKQTDRETSFCKYSLLDAEEFFVVPDTLLDPRFANNPKVTGAPFIRFFASVKLTTSSGQAIGCFLLIDTKPGTLSQDQKKFLSKMGKESVKYLEGLQEKKELGRLLFLEKEVYHKLLLSTVGLASSAPTFDEALHRLVLHLDPELGWLSARIRNMQTGGTTGIRYNPLFAEDKELPLLWNTIDSTPSHPGGDAPGTRLISSAPLCPEYCYLVVPVRIRQQLVAVLEFFYLDQRYVDERVREVFNLIAANLAIVAEHELVSTELKYKSEHDAVSSAPNRELFVSKLTKVLQEEAPIQHNRKVLLFCFDVNGFHGISDDFGYEAGVQLLKDIAKRAERFCKPEDFLGRLMGGEFMLTIHGKEPYNETEAIIRRVETTLNGDYQVGEILLNVSMSIGCVVVSSSDNSAVDLIRRAEEAMHLVKNGIRSGVCIADETLAADFMKRREMNSRVKEAVKNKRLTLHYQPIIELASGRIVGAEALLRMLDQDGSIQVADTFISALERTRMLPNVDSWVISEILILLNNSPVIMKKIPDFYFSHNVTPEMIGRPDFQEHFLTNLKSSRIQAKSVRIEITEKALLPNDVALRNNLTILKENGVLVALDDFGTGFSNLQSISQYPIDTIKIDRSFLAGILTKNAPMNSLLTSIIEIAKNFGCTIVGEGIEHKEQADHLLALGCMYGQGYLFGKAMPLTELSALIENQ